MMRIECYLWLLTGMLIMKFNEFLKIILPLESNKISNLRLYFGLRMEKLSFLRDNYSLNHFKEMIYKSFDNESLKSKEYTSFVEIESTSLNNEMTPYDLMQISESKVYKRWSRWIEGGEDGNAPVNSSFKLILSILLTALIAADLDTYGIDRLNSFVDLYYNCLELLGIEIEENLLVNLCSLKYEKTFSDWKQSFSKDASKSSHVKYYPYDLLCITIYTTIEQIRLINSKRTTKRLSNTIIEILQRLLHEHSQDYEAEITDDYKDYIIKRILSLKKSNDYNETKEKTFGLSESPYYGLYGDSRFARQSNLYYSIDMQAINTVLKQFTKNRLYVLDLGCGDGEVSYSRFGNIPSVSKVICVDKNSHQLEIAKSRFKHKQTQSNFEFVNLDINDDDFIFNLKRVMASFQIEKFDIIFSSLTFHYLNSPETTLSHLRRVLQDDGYLILRELNDDTKLYYSLDDVNSQWMKKALNAYQRAFKYSSRNCAQKMHSWLTVQGYHNIQMFYDTIDTCEKSLQEKEDIYYIMIGFRKARAEKRLEEGVQSETERQDLEELIYSCNNLQNLFKERDFWFFCINYVAIARNTKKETENEKRPKIELYIIRHAHCEFFEQEGESDIKYDISKIGEKQIVKLTDRLSDVSFDEIVCSSYERSYRTAMPIAESHSLKLKRFKEIDEINRGDVVSDNDWEKSKNYYIRWRTHLTDLPFPNGENGTDVWLRAKYVINSIIENAKRSGKGTSEVYRACIVSHGGAIRSIICGLLDMPQSSRYQLGMEVKPCSISIVDIASNPKDNINTDGIVTLELFNDISHLERD